MPISRALIVDDSRTAQQRLKKLLSRYQLEIDLATSAEEALGYLSYKMPSVIFMDHHMEGMDGFAALKIIKANPATATIPVIMYTSKSDKVYASQALALGALDTLSKNLMKPARIEEVLAKLKVFPSTDNSKEVRSKGAASTEDVAAVGARASRVTASDFKAQIARLFELHIADVRTQISENTKFIVRRLASEIKNASTRDQENSEGPFLLVDEESRAGNNRMATISNWLLCLILLGLVAISFQLFQAHQQSQKLEEDVSRIADPNQYRGLSENATSGSPRYKESFTKADYRALLDTISWALNIDTHFDYGEAPLGDAQILNLQNLTFRLYEAGFRGFIELDIRLGNFCLIQAEGGDWVIPPENTPLNQCTFLNAQKIDLSAENYTSVAYLQFEQSTAPIQNGDIEFIINVSAFENPLYTYPSILPTTNAGQWNAVAKQNQQIVLSMDSGE